MKLLFDENLSFRLCRQLSDVFRVRFKAMQGRVGWV